MIKQLFTLLLGSFLSVAVCAQTQLSKETQSYVTHPRGLYVLQNATIVDGTGVAAQTDQDIIINGEIIEAIGENLKVPEGATILDMTGKSIMPGMVMLHEHLFYPKATPGGTFGVSQMSYSFPKLYLAGGVTTMRTAGSIMPQADINLKNFILEGKVPGPKIDATSPFLDRDGLGILETYSLKSTKQAIEAVKFYADMGSTSFKVYNYITRADLKAITETAHSRGFKVTGHLCSITHREAADLGIDNLEHGFMASSDFIDNKTPDECEPFKQHKSLLDLPVDSPKMEALIEHLVKKNVAVTSTINVFEPYTGREVVPGGGLKALYQDARDKVYRRWASKQNRDSLDYVLFNKSKVWEKAFHDAGGLLVAGTDPTYDGRIVAGYANMRLLEIFVEMGFSIPEAIKICTMNGATYLEQADSIGSIAPTKIADLLILNGDISKDIKAIRNIETTFRNGIGYSSEKLFRAADGKVGVR
ncbi:amidohydrolase family protein [Gaetbulibacter sp. M240]|uniref:amidohydrolase family protein n=1 Tax=Gaetbulibacter sp. M240 TaxID=3126511 RepID=UPI00374EC079